MQSIVERQALPPSSRNDGGETAAKWLSTLGLLVAGRMATADARARLSAFGPLLADYPVRVFTMETLREAARRFKWFPSYAELAELLDEVAREIGSRVPLRRHIAASVEPWPPPPKAPEQLAQIAALVDQCRTALGVVPGGRNQSRRMPVEARPLTPQRRAEIAVECASFRERFAATPTVAGALGNTDEA